LILRVEFVWRGDRYGHVISAVIGGQTELLLESLEGTPADDWPPSPPLQSLHRERLPDGRTALLLVGAAGRSHWSASVEALAEPRLIFDIACRHSGRPLWLGSQYQRAPAALNRLAIQPDNAGIEGHEQQVRIGPSAPPATATSRWRFSLRLNP